MQAAWRCTRCLSSRCSIFFLFFGNHYCIKLAYISCHQGSERSAAHCVMVTLAFYHSLLKYCFRCYRVLLMNSPKALYLMGLHLNKPVKILFAWVFVFCPLDAFLEVLEGGYSCFAARGKAPFTLGKYGRLNLRFCLISVHSALP